MYEVRYGTPERWKSLKTDREEHAVDFFNRCVAFAKQHKLSWTIALWERGWKIQSVRME